MNALTVLLLAVFLHLVYFQGFNNMQAKKQSTLTKIFIPYLNQSTHGKSKLKCKATNRTLASLLTTNQIKRALDAIKNLTEKKFWVGLKNNGTALNWLNGVALDDDIARSLTGKSLSQLMNSSIDSTKDCFYLTSNGMQHDFCSIGLPFLCQGFENISTVQTTTAATTKKTERPTKATTPNKRTTKARTTHKRPTNTTPTQKRPTKARTTHQRPTNARTTKKPQPTRPRTPTDELVDSYVKKIKSVDVKKRNSIKNVKNMTESFLKNLRGQDQHGKKKQGNVMKATLQLEKFSLEYAKQHLNNNEVMAETGDGFALEMRRVTREPKQSLVFPPRSDQDSTGSIDLPASLFSEGRIVVSSIFTGVTELIPTVTDESGIQQQIISSVISSTLDPKPDGILPENVTITLQHQEKSFQPSCVFWDVNADESNGAWSSLGCTLLDKNQNRTICSCNHLTSFALLMQIDKKEQVSHKHELALSYITYIGCSFSLVGEALTILAYVLLMNTKHEQSQIRVNLAISLALAQIFYLSGITATENLGVCTFVAVMIHFFYLVAFGWMMLEGVYLYLMVVKVFNTVIKLNIYYAFAWGLPLVMVLISLVIAVSLEDGIKSYTNSNFCWVNFSNGLVWTFVVPVLIISLLNMAILIRVVRELWRLNHAKSNDADTFRQGVKACVVLFPLLGFTWVFGLLTVTDAGLFFQYIFTILNSFQGLLIFVFHVLRSGEIRGAFRRKVQRWETTRGTNFASRSATENSVSYTDKKPLKNFASMESLQDSLPRSNQVTPAPSNNMTMTTAMTPVENMPSSRL